jgi:hypothetical protein
MSTKNELSDSQRMLLHAIMFSSLLSTPCDGIFVMTYVDHVNQSFFCWQRLKIVLNLYRCLHDCSPSLYIVNIK